MTNPSSENYIKMWDDFAKNKSQSYLTDKYSAGNIVGLTGLSREHEIFKQLSLVQSDTLLDVGCASGRQVFKAARVCKMAIGIDVGREFIETAEQAQKRLGILNVEFKLVDGEKIPFEDGFFDKLICSEVLEHVVDHNAFIEELKRVLKSGGVAVLTVPNWNNRGTFYKRLKNVFRPFPFTPITDFSTEGIMAHGDAHVRQFTLRTFRDFVASHGLPWF
jgi:ubiquinone/menaquinone biosynthesis C-methylase UbiE